jgi:hypothetical protein
MAFVSVSNKDNQPGALPGIDMSAYILDPAKLFATHKARVIADGGIVKDEAATLSEFTFIVNNGFYDRISAWPYVNGGVKVDAQGNVQKVYSLVGPDFIAVLAAGSANPVPTIKLDETGAQRGVQILLSNGGYYLRSETVLKLQAAPNKKWLLSARMRDVDLADNAGISMAWGVASSTSAFFECRKTTTISNPWKYVATNVVPPTSGSYVAATQTPYADFVPSAGLFNALTGEVIGYEGGIVKQAGTSPTGALADLSGTSNYLWIGTTYLAQAGNLNVCNGTFASARCLNQATENDAILLSSRV